MEDESKDTRRALGSVRCVCAIRGDGISGDIVLEQVRRGILRSSYMC